MNVPAVGAFDFSRRLDEPRTENALSRALAERRAAGLPILNLAESNPTRAEAGLAPDLLLAALARPENAHYEPEPHGLAGARQAIAARYRTFSREPALEDLFCSASTSEAYAWIFKLLCDPGDAILVPRPGYPLFDHLAGLEGVQARPYRLEYAHPRGWKLDLDALERSLEQSAPTDPSLPVPGRVRAIVLIHPNNPTGSYVSDDEREALVALAARHRLVLVVDEVFRSYDLDGPERPSFADETRVPTLVLDGLSKLACAPQLKLGWLLLAGPEAWRSAARARLEIIADAYLSASAAVMNAAPAILADVDQRILALKKRLSGNLAALRAAFEYPASPFRVLTCQAGWTALLEVPRLESDEDLAIGLLLDEGLAVQPGYLFDLERDGILALSLLPPGPSFAEGLERLKRYLGRLLAPDEQSGLAVATPARGELPRSPSPSCLRNRPTGLAT